MTQVATFAVEHSAYLDADGKALQPLPEALAQPDTLRALYRWMTLARAFDAKAIELQRTGRLGTYASCLGQEAAGVGVGYAMQPEDVLLPSFREQAVQLVRGVTATELLLYWGGDERGSDFHGPRQDFPISITVGGHAPHAAGVALAFKLRAEARVAVCAIGDGATSKGDLYEAMNVAGAWQLPLVFVVNNNQWAISMPRAEQSAARTLAQKAIAAGFTGEQVDGNDVVAVTDVVGKAIAHARAGGGPRLVECLTYRLSDHTTVDDASRYRSDEEVSRHWHEDPLKRLRLWLEREHGWSAEDDDACRAECEASITAAADAYLATPPQAPESLFDYLYETLPDDLRAQRDALLAEPRDEHGHG
ncbi:MAG: pyruvate dehydrogenase (acetyl-transferring) E1 component subunit alpha [Pseudomonadales bacterium]